MSLRSRTGVLLLATALAAQVLAAPAGAHTVTLDADAPSIAPRAGGSDGTRSSTAAPETATATLDGLPTAYAAAATGAEPGEVMSASARAPIPFSMLGLELPAGSGVRVRTSADGASWTGWVEVDQYGGADGPDLGSREATGSQETRHTEPLWVGAASHLQVALEGATPGEVTATFIDTLGHADGDGGTTSDAPEADAGEHAATGTGTGTGGSTITGVPMPGAVTRARWDADESMRSGSPAYATRVRFAVVHHTAGSNDYSEAQAPAVVRGILAYHTEVLGWSDIGYNVLVDRYGNVYEGRAGGMERAVIGAHAQGFNTGALGVSVMGDFTSVAPPKVAQDAVAQVIAWSFKRHGVDPAGGVVLTSGGSNKYPAGRQVPMSTIFGHRDAGQTSCPGALFYSRLPALRAAVASRMASLPAPSPTPVVTPSPPAPVPAPVIVPARPAAPSFTDIAGSVHAASIELLASTGVTGGCGGGRYCPDQQVTRAQAVSLLVRAAAIPAGVATRFTDVPAGHTHAAAIRAAVSAGLIAGYADGTFRPEALVSREQLATLLGRAAGLSRTPGQYFSDVPWASPHLPWVNAIGAAGVSEGCGGGRYCPTRTATRGQMATFVAAAFD